MIEWGGFSLKPPLFFGLMGRSPGRREKTMETSIEELYKKMPEALRALRRKGKVKR
jgi:hypothetical protein